MPTRDAVKKAVSAMKTAADYDYFFDRLSSPQWIAPLLEEGLLKNPPDPKPQGEGTWFPPWAGSRYLARMALENPEAVRDAIRAIPETANVRVHEDFVEAALAMPPEIASDLVDLAGQWIQSGPYFLLPQKLGQLVVRLADAGKIDEAFDLASALVGLRTGERLAWADAENLFDSVEAEPLFDNWDYGEILRLIVPALARENAERALDFFSQLLDEALLVPSGRDEPPDGPTEDLSYVWRPAIEDHEENWRGDAKDHLVVAVREVCVAFVEGDRSTLESLVNDLFERPWRVYHRIALHLLDRFGDSALALVGEALTRQDLLDELGVRHEFALLMHHYFPSLDTQAQGEILRLVTEGFDEERFRRRYQEARGSEPTEEETREYEAFRRRDGLWLIGRDALPADRRDELDGLIAQLGSPERPAEESSFSQSWVGPTSPLEPEELKTKDTDSIIDFLKTWEQPSGHMVPTPEGLGRVLSAVAAEDPGRFAAEALRFKEVDPTYVRGLLGGLRESLKQGKTFEWEPVIDLCAWVGEQPRDIPGRTGEYMDLDPGWVWVRKSIADLLADGFSKKAPGPPFELREKCWAALEPITSDPEPDSDYEERFGGDNMDSPHLSINTVRGQAMHALVFYLLWVRRNLVDEQGLTFTLDDDPGAKNVLEAHLDAEEDPSLAVRAVYGWHFPRLSLVDAKWARSVMDRIFPLDPTQQPFFDAAWGAYVVFNPAIKEVVDVLRPAYETAIARLSPSDVRDRRLHDPDEHLAHHLMALYWQGHQDLEPGSLVSEFFDKASSQLRLHSLVFVGRSLLEMPEIPDEVRARLKMLWEWRADTVSDDPPREMAGFGWWFASPHLDEEWSLEQLKMVLGRARDVDPRHLVAERLTVLVNEHPHSVVESLRLFIETADKPWDVYGIRDEAMTILRKALESEQGNAADLARTVIHSLGARGFREFRSLLGPPAPETDVSGSA